MNRRGFLASILAAGAAPWVMSGGIASGILMPVRKPLVPSVDLLSRLGAQAGGTLQLFSGIPGGDGKLLATIKYPGGDLTKQAETLVASSGVYSYARLKHPLYGDVPVDMNFNSDTIYAGQIISVSPILEELR